MPLAPILDIADLTHRRAAAEATAGGAALFYAFGNFCALAARPDLDSLQAMNRLKGRPLNQVGSVTTTPEKAASVFAWDNLPGLSKRLVTAVMSDLHALGPIGFRGPAADHIPDHLTQRDGDTRTVQLISPGDRCPSNALVAEVLERANEEILYITSANRTGDGSAAHCEMAEIQRDFGREDNVVLIGHRNEARNRRAYPVHRPCSTSIVAFHRGVLTLERHGSLHVSEIRNVALRRGLALAIADEAHERVPMKRPRPALARRSRVHRGTAELAR
jgi:tRNA A37 threonylcarbamoyladenosine synthetase subunit TsaC/SUA5/YrdC